ncbi:ATP-binding protein [Kutzneria sp. NPDC052558]|uniref:ATP-binding protein n=1 Tax=Kutzneria sp. NPDC052558 TaxID=3364121 RepID=UPI0037C7C02D
MSEFGGELRRLRLAAGLSLRGLAARVHYSKGYLSKVENGRARPNPDFARACEAVLDADGALVALAGAAVTVTGAGISGLPLRTPHFTGRRTELARIEEALLDRGGAAIGCVLSGMAGVGKTALAVRAAGAAQPHFPDGCLFFDLRGYPAGATEVSSEEALDRVLRVLGVPGADIPPDQDGRANLYRDRLRGKRMLLVFDNVRGTGQVAPLLPAEPRCRVIITSRNRLNALDDAVHVPIGELAMAEAVALFRSVVGDDERLPAADEPVAAVVEYCGRLPLAVRIAAARFRAGPPWTFDDFARRLSDEAARLTALDDGERSVAAAFALSYQQLSDQQKRVFALLALHPGRDIATPSAAALAGLEPAAAEQVLGQLANAHLIIERAGGYHQFHDLVRMFATEHALAEVPHVEREAAVTRLLDLALARTRACDELLAPQRYRPDLLSHPAIEGFAGWDCALSWLDVEWPNLVALCRTAAELGQHERCWRLALLLRDFFFRTKLWDPWIETHRHAAASAMAEGNTVAVAMTVNNLGMAYADRGDLDRARDNHRQALALFREIGDDNGATVALSNLAWVTLYLGQPETALRDMVIALESYRRAGSTRNAAITLRGMALAEVELGAFADALRHAEQARDEFAGTDLDAAMALNCIAWVHYRAGRHQASAAHYQQAALFGERGRSPHEVARAKTGLGNIAATAGDHVAASQLWADATRLHPDLSAVTVGEATARLAWEQTATP